jgi:heme A synthase
MTGILHMHSALRYVALIFIVLAIAHAFLNKNNPHAKATKWSLFAFITLHTQLLLGLILWAIKFMHAKAEGTVTSIAENRFFIMEHSVIMILAIVLISMGHIKSKKETDVAKKYNTVFWYFLIGLILILAMIPWPFLAYTPDRGWF